jgi:hypothetical protein
MYIIDEYFYDRKIIFKHYLKTYLIFDSLSVFPISLYAYLEKDRISNITYKVFLATKLIRLRKVEKYA